VETGIAEVDLLPFWFWAIFVSLFGLIIGSFLNVVIYRVPLEKSIVTPRSSCPNCGHQITALENIPVLSYLVLRGRCSGCHVQISPRYPFVEALTATCFLLVFWKQASLPNFSILHLIADAAFASACIALVFIDYDHMILPNSITLPGAVLAIVVRLFVPNLVSPEASFYAIQLAILILVMLGLFIALGNWGRSKIFSIALLVVLIGFIVTVGMLNVRLIDWYLNLQADFFIFWQDRISVYPTAVSFINGLLGAVIGAGVLLMLREAYFVLRKIEGMGLGDVKMMLLVGAYLGWQLAIATLVLASFLGTIIAMALFARKGREALHLKIPFGVFLGGAAIILLLFGNEILNWYIQLLIVR
jgi:leader peptidase (prepilin peptidase) / N-methyltransferase